MWRSGLVAAALLPALPAQRLREVPRLPFPAWVTGTKCVEAHDFDGDGDVDVLLGNYGWHVPSQEQLLLNDGRGGFTDVSATHLPQPPVVSAHDTWDIAVGDVDGDGDLDALIGNNMFFSVPPELWLNDGRGHFTDVSFTHLLPSNRIGEGTGCVELLDLDVDGDLDLLIGSVTGPSVSLVAFENDGTGVLREASSKFIPWASVGFGRVWDMDVGDLDADGDPDVVLSFDGSHTTMLLINDGTGRLRDETATRFLAPLRSSVRAALGDVDGDGDSDLVLTGTSPASNFYESLYLNDGGGTFRAAPTGSMPNQGGTSGDLELADLDGDGDFDLIVANAVSANLTTGYDYVYLNDGTGRFTDVSAAWLTQQSSGSTGLGVADFDGDGDPDVVISTAFTPFLPCLYRINHLRHLEPAGPAMPGQPYRLDFEGDPGLVAVAYIAGRTAQVAVPPFGTWGLDPRVAFPLPGMATLSAQRRGSITLLVPNDPGLRGLVFYVQGALVDLGDLLASRFTAVVDDRVQ